MNAQLAEIMRLINNIIRTGVVAEVDSDRWLCRVQTGELVTDWISWLTLRAGTARTWWQPSVGEQVLLLSIGGNLDTAFVLPAIYSGACPPPATTASASITAYPDGGWFEYDADKKRWLVRGVQNVVIEDAQNMEFNAKAFTFNGDTAQFNAAVKINGAVTQSGGAMSSNGVVVDKHIHGAVKTGNDTSGGPQ